MSGEHSVKYLVVALVILIKDGEPDLPPSVPGELVLPEHLEPAVRHVLGRVGVDAATESTEQEAPMIVRRRHAQSQAHLGLGEVSVAVARKDALRVPLRGAAATEFSFSLFISTWRRFNVRSCPGGISL